MAKKMLSMLLALSMMLTVLAACNTKPVDDVENSDLQEEVQGGEAVSDVLTLVADGVSDYVIVRGENAYISEVTATTELQKYIKQISGVEIPIVTDSTEPVEKEIVVGKTNREADGEFDREELGNDGLVIKTNGQKLFLVGGEQRGTLYAVYEFLESYLGCRFYTSTYEKIPELKTVSLEQIEEDKQIPVFDERELLWYDYMNNYYFKAKRKINGQKWGPIPEEYGSGDAWAGLPGHTIGILSESTAGQPCFTDENIYQTTLKNVRALLAANPDAKYISVSQNDDISMCSCDNCMAIVEQYGTYGGLNIWFVNIIAEEIKDEYPDVMIHTFAYHKTRHVPTNIEVADNVMVELCTIEACFSHAIEDCDSLSGESFSELFNGWAEICDTLAVWDYTTNYHHYALIFPNFDVLRQNMRLFADNNVEYVFEQGNHSANSLEFGELRGYLLSKLAWDPYMSDEEFDSLMVEFCKDFYGPGWESIIRYIQLAEEESSSKCFDIYSEPDDVYNWTELVEFNDSKSYPDDLTVEMVKNYETVDWSKYWNWYKGYVGEEPKILSEGEKLFQTAISLAETETQKTNLDKAYTQIQYLRSYYIGLNISVGTGSVGKMVGYFMEDHPDDFTTEDRMRYRKNIISIVNEQIYADYIEFNKAIAEKSVSYNVYSLREKGNLNDLSVLDYRLLPAEWYP